MPRHRGVGKATKRHIARALGPMKRVKIEPAETEDPLIEEKKKSKSLSRKLSARELRIQGLQKKSKQDEATISVLQKV